MPVLKTSKWEDRMEKTKRDAAIRKLQQELKDEKQAEFTR
jgi:rRNA-processing protein CGR1